MSKNYDGNAVGKSILNNKLFWNKENGEMH